LVQSSADSAAAYPRGNLQSLSSSSSLEVRPWTQGNAVEVLVRLAARGIEREQIIVELRREFPRLRVEAQLYSVGPLLDHAARDSAVAALMRELNDISEWRAAVEELGRAGDT